MLPLAEVIRNWDELLHENDSISNEDDIRYFHPFDLISPEAQCGLIIKPNSPDNGLIGYNYSGEMEIDYLDLDFKGYITMAVEAKIFFYWPKVLLDIKNSDESSELSSFKENMPTIFKEFDFDKFKEKYQSLRLKNR